MKRMNGKIIVVAMALLLVSSVLFFISGSPDGSDTSSAANLPAEGTESYTVWSIAFSSGSTPLTFAEAIGMTGSTLCKMSDLYKDGSFQDSNYAFFDSFYITDKGDFNSLSDAVNKAKKDFSGKKIFLINDLDFGGSEAVSVGWYYQSTLKAGFSGYFYGCGFSIKNVTVNPYFENDTTVSNAGGVFGVVKPVSNVGIYDLKLSSVFTKASSMAGLLVGCISSTSNAVTIDGCSADSGCTVNAVPYWNEASFNGTGGTSAPSNLGTLLNDSKVRVGFIAWCSSPLTLNNVVSSATINVDYSSVTTKVEAYVGGILGYGLESLTFRSVEHNGTVLVGTDSKYSSTTNCYVGGVIGNCTKGSLDIVNNGDVGVQWVKASSNTIHVGGEIGYNKSGTLDTESGNKCAGSVTVAYCDAQQYLIGGFMGSAGTSDSKCTFNNCTFEGRVSINSCIASSNKTVLMGVGGVFGTIYGTVSELYTSSRASISIKDVTLNEFQIGGLIGFSSVLKMDKCTNNASLSVSDLKYTGSSGNLKMGGVVGIPTSSDNMVDVHNTGSVYLYGSSLNLVYVGGVCGQSKMKMDTVSNSGAVLVYNTNAGELDIGGVEGLKNGALKAVNESNSGNITVNGNNVLSKIDGTASVGVGGVVGVIWGSTTTAYDGFINTGDLRMNNGNSFVVVDIGGVIGFSKSSVSGAVNKGEITASFDSSSNSRIGGVIGRLETNTTSLTGCSNVGSLVVKDSKLATLYCGGVIGYANNTAAKTSLSDLYNHGLAIEGVTASGAVYIGGVVGTIASTDNATTCARMYNEGNVTFGDGNEFKGKTYIGGVIGYSGRTVSTMENRGNVTVSFDSNNSTVHVGGVIGNLDKDTASLTGCSNEGSLVVKDSKLSALDCGGVIGYANNTAAKTSLSDLYNHGLAIEGVTVSGNVRVGGVVGTIVSTTNSTTCKDMYNEGNVTFGDGNKFNGGVNIGGVIGLSGRPVSDIENRGSVTVSFDSNNTAVRIGGVVGGISVGPLSKAYNKGSFIIKDSNLVALDCGGVVGYSTVKIDNVENNGQVTLSFNSTGSNNRIGGVTGYLDKGSLNNAYNKGCLTVKDSSLGSLYCGGVLGYADDTKNSTELNGLSTSDGSNVVIKNLSITVHAHVGGILGYQNGSKSCSGFINCGDMDLHFYNVIGDINFGGIVGYTKGAVDHCINEGDLKVSVGYTNNDINRIGGLVGYVDSVVSDSYNVGGLEVSFGSLTRNKVVTIGGLAGYSKGSLERCWGIYDAVLTIPKLTGRIGSLAGEVNGIVSCFTISTIRSNDICVGPTPAYAVSSTIENSYVTDGDTVHYSWGVSTYSGFMGSCIDGLDFKDEWKKLNTYLEGNSKDILWYADEALNVLDGFPMLFDSTLPYLFRDDHEASVQIKVIDILPLDSVKVCFKKSAGSEEETLELSDTGTYLLKINYSILVTGILKISVDSKEGYTYTREGMLPTEITWNPLEVNVSFGLQYGADSIIGKFSLDFIPDNDIENLTLTIRYNLDMELIVMPASATVNNIKDSSLDKGTYIAVYEFDFNGSHYKGTLKDSVVV